MTRKLFKPRAARAPVKNALRRIAYFIGVPLLVLFAVYWLRPEWALRAEFQRQAWLAGVAKKEVTIGEHRWVYYEGGQGDVVVLVHGFTGSKENWLPMQDALTRDHRVIIPDLPGWGETTRVDGADYDVAAQVARLAEFLDALKLPRVHLVGHSMGGHIAGVFAAEHGEHVLTLSLVDSAGVHFNPNEFANQILAGGTPFNVDDAAGWDTLMATLFDKQPYLPPRVRDLLIERNIASHEFQSALIREMSTGADAFRLERELANIKPPTLVVWCAHDRVLDVSSMQTIRRQLPTATYVTLQGCSHMPMMEEPMAMARVLRDFIAPLPVAPEQVDR
jgi:abhydrolase domain-containing protein 6